MIYSTEVQNMCPVAKGAYHMPASELTGATLQVGKRKWARLA